MPFSRLLIFFLLFLFVLSCQPKEAAGTVNGQKKPLKYCDCHYEYLSGLKKSFQKGNKLINWKYALSQPPENTEKALIAFRRKNGLSAEGIIDGEVYRLLGW